MSAKMMASVWLRKPEVLAVQRYVQAERIGNGYDEEDGDEALRVLRQIVAQHAALLPKKSGLCFVCGCSMLDACPGGCSWVDREETLCSACAPAKVKIVKRRGT